MAEAEGLSVADWEALSVIVRAGEKCTPTTLATTLRLTSGTVSTRLSRLLSAGLVSAADDVDGRSRPVRVTEEGRLRWQRATERRTQLEVAAFSVLKTDEIGILNDLLRPLLRHYEASLGTRVFSRPTLVSPHRNLVYPIALSMRLSSLC
ncbi:MarR family winged helix-turn-helix transcriptional regulator [Gordonia sp. (in: high G+C Gram-positive bacteria)]|uniref:MarR family winged helix-turn-helix transcriptional regulator n=1 Tax=Gordonia sp. (in: high G+C Gram-positive bacteria) TaxID=84139 RepID=UPI003F96020B